MENRMLALALFVAICQIAPAPALAQAKSLPADLSGRWTFAPAGRTNTFSLDEIKPASDSTFTALLTWWTADPACTIRKTTITGRVTEGGIAFDSKTKCDVEFTVELTQGEKEWTGKAVTKGANVLTLDLRAK